MTYPDPAVEAYIEEHFIPVQFNVSEQPEAMEQFNTPWTPTLIVQDAEGREHRRAQGYLDPKR
ncbi:MAG TPA: thioredoxin family protein, partial [Armatimonadota bacterium]|nr:thioredoxin family protein [Armatimonadota bacterium]